MNWELALEIATPLVVFLVGQVSSIAIGYRIAKVIARRAAREEVAGLAHILSRSAQRRARKQDARIFDLERKVNDTLAEGDRILADLLRADEATGGDGAGAFEIDFRN